MHRHLGFWASTLALVGLWGCAASDREERHWTEDVQLEDGSIVQIERYVAFDATNAMGGGAYNAVESKATLKFKGELESLPPWDFPRIALVLYRSKETGNWVVVSTSSSCEVWDREGKPRPPYWQHELIDGQWKKTFVSTESIGKKNNLFYSYWKGAPKHVTAETTNALQSDPTIVEKYRHVAVDPENFNC
jgi:hypothetical protein